MTSKKETRGRPPVDDKKVIVYVLPRQSEVDALGGKDAVKKLCEKYIAKKSKEKK
jgi:hypothetical protein